MFRNVFSKVKAGGIAGIIVTIIVGILKAAWGIELPEPVVAALVTVISFIVGFFKIERVGSYG